MKIGNEFIHFKNKLFILGYYYLKKLEKVEKKI